MSRPLAKAGNAVVFIIGTGPTELHAHIDLEHRIQTDTAGGARRVVTVLDTSSCDGHWSVVANVHPVREDGTREIR